ncbi:recombinase family protein, partial [Clostridium perfringens]
IEIIDTLIDKGVRVVILKEGIDTSNKTYKLLVGIFGSIAEMERETIQERTKQSIEALKEIKEETGEIKTKSGKWFGREEKTVDDLPSNFEKYYSKMINKEITKVEMSKLLGVGRATVYRWIRIYENK